MEVLLLLVMGIANVACFVIGAKVGQTVTKGKEIEIPSPNPMEVIRRAEDSREAKREQDRLETIMANIERYDGTSAGQRDVPGR